MHNAAKNTYSPRTRLVELRRELGKTQREVAIDLGITQTHLGLLERGKATPSVDLLFKIASYYKSDVYEAWPDIAGSRPGSTTTLDK
ncbi:hypothetical protein Alches_01680 [Alicyclobacillus hesperidum subsp. aegles]|uniref:helix-turn-helix transcriptional regulator n=1 Tax=Alicyclobacillus hesperidum TaxID=89784 RepID=UPI002229A3E3|nr:helix-turn-helix transcriptional regulator [Alicyclobacillus hesperidum]GLG00129.1 hypothetical protein Alches_01680 [Alicyclobacillus hesperidum subsp. aegles]